MEIKGRAVGPMTPPTRFDGFPIPTHMAVGNLNGCDDCVPFLTR